MMWGEENTMRALGEALTWWIVIGFFAILVISIFVGICAVYWVVKSRKIEKDDIFPLVMFVLSVAVSILLVHGFWSDIIWFISRSWVFYTLLVLAMLVSVGWVIRGYNDKGKLTVWRVLVSLAIVGCLSLWMFQHSGGFSYFSPYRQQIEDYYTSSGYKPGLSWSFQNKNLTIYTIKEMEILNEEETMRKIEDPLGDFSEIAPAGSRRVRVTISHTLYAKNGNLGKDPQTGGEISEIGCETFADFFFVDGKIVCPKKLGLGCHN